MSGGSSGIDTGARAILSMFDEAARVHFAVRRRSGVAIRGARAADRHAGDRILAYAFAGGFEFTTFSQRMNE